MVNCVGAFFFFFFYECEIRIIVWIDVNCVGAFFLSSPLYPCNMWTLILIILLLLLVSTFLLKNGKVPPY